MANTSKKKGGSKKTVVITRRGGIYELTSKDPGELSPQGKIIYDALQKMQPATSAQLAEKVTGKLDTKQSPRQVVTYYLMVWKGEGLVRNSKSAEKEREQQVKAAEAASETAAA